MLDLIIAQGIFRLLIFEDLLHTMFDGEMCGDEVMKSEFSDLIGYDRRWGGVERMTEARTADLWLKIDQLHLRFLQVVSNTQCV